MNRSNKLIFAVTNDLNYDQRMIRICTSLSRAGYDVTIVGRHLPTSIPLAVMPYRQFRIKCFRHKGFAFYTEFNIRLFFYLLYRKADLICAIDLDTIIPCYLNTVIKNIPRVYDAHELFCEMKEVATRPRVYRFWKAVERLMLPRFKYGYTVNNLIANEFKKLYGVDYASIRNVPYPSSPGADMPRRDKCIILYQGAVNEARCFETLIPAFQSLNAKLIICGDGNFMEQARQIVKDNRLDHKVQFTGWLSPEILKTYTQRAYVGVTIFENRGQSNIFSLANRFFDFIQSALPQVCVNYPAYREINNEYHCAYLINDTSTPTIVKAIQTLLDNDDLYNTLRTNCIRAASVLNWSVEEQKLLSFYQNIFERA
jgi:glycosyltransferase involved in cell wall biosynthesis